MAARFRGSIAEINSSAEIFEETPESSPAIFGYSRQATRRIPSDPIDSGISDSGTKSTTPEGAAQKHRSPQVIYASDEESSDQEEEDEDILGSSAVEGDGNHSRFRGASISQRKSHLEDESVLVPRKKKSSAIISDDESEDDTSDVLAKKKSNAIISEDESDEDTSDLLANKEIESPEEESDDDVPLVRRRNHNNIISDDSSEEEEIDTSGLIDKGASNASRTGQSRKFNKRQSDSPDVIIDNSREELSSDEFLTPTSGSDDESQPISRPKPSMSSTTLETPNYDRSPTSRPKLSSLSKPSPVSSDLLPSPTSPDSQPVFLSAKSKMPEKPQRDVVVVSSDDGDDDDVQVVKEISQTYSREDLNEIEKQIKSLKSTILTNEHMLAVNGRRLPDGGASIKRTIDQDKRQMEMLRQKLGSARSHLTKSVSAGVLPQPIRMMKTLSGSSMPAINNEPPHVLLDRAKKKKSEIQSALKYSSRLSDGGDKMRVKLDETELEIKNLEKQVQENLKLTASSASNVLSNDPAAFHNKAWQTLKQNFHEQTTEELARMMTTGPAQQLYGGRMTYDRQKEVKSVTQEAVARLHKSLDTMPAEGDMEEQPRVLKSDITLFPHQKQALAWLVWREHQSPPGGILADDMGLGKTLTMVSLILKDAEIEQDIKKDDDEKENAWKVRGVGNLIKTKTTLIICPASLMGQWENEIKSKVKSGCLRVLVYHGASARKATAREMARYNVIITTYGVILSEVKAELGDTFKEAKKLESMGAVEEMVAKTGKLLSLAFHRIILDEAHQIRNPRSLQSQAVCKLRAARRWCVTGTPIQNKELDMYSLVRFLRCNPFDEYLIWKRWVENKSAQSEERMKLLVKSLLLRRTKDQKSNITGKVLVDLPDKNVETHEIELSKPEMEVYSEVEKFAKGAMEKFMDQKEDGGERRAMGFGGRGPTGNDDFAFNPYKGEDDEVKMYHLLTLLLRMRQICCHPGLIRKMLDSETKQNEGLDKEIDEMDLISKLEDMNITKEEEKSPMKILQMENPVFSDESPSSKIATVIRELKRMKRRGEENGNKEKAVVVSQWTDMLNILKKHIKEEGFQFTEITGQVAISARSEIVERFNKDRSGPQIMLLSLAAGGVGLNLVGANHLFLLDMHWNPQLESQACDRIYRVGQKREVKIHKFLIKNSVEERIHKLQQNKLKLADDMLSGAKKRTAHKLSFDDMKSLFQVA